MTTKRAISKVGKSLSGKKISKKAAALGWAYEDIQKWGYKFIAGKSPKSMHELEVRLDKAVKAGIISEDESGSCVNSIWGVPQPPCDDKTFLRTLVKLGLLERGNQYSGKVGDYLFDECTWLKTSTDIKDHLAVCLNNKCITKKEFNHCMDIMTGKDMFMDVMVRIGLADVII